MVSKPKGKEGLVWRRRREMMAKEPTDMSKECDVPRAKQAVPFPFWPRAFVRTRFESLSQTPAKCDTRKEVYYTQTHRAPIPRSPPIAGSLLSIKPTIPRILQKHIFYVEPSSGALQQQVPMLMYKIEPRNPFIFEAYARANPTNCDSCVEVYPSTTP